MNRTITIFLLLIMLPVILLSVDFFISSTEQPYIYGDFNDWQPLKMEKAAGSWWFAEVDLKPGTYKYYFATEGGRRIVDPFKSQLLEGSDTLNKIEVKDPADFFGLSDKDFLFKIWDRDYFNPVKPGEFFITFSATEGISDSFYLILNGEKYEMNLLRNYDRVNYFRLHLQNVKELNFYFGFSRGNEKLYFGANGLSDSTVTSFSIPLDDLPVDYFDTPEWSKGAIYYQIFPERFANGDPKNDPENSQDWYIDPQKANLGSSGFFGGDLQGVLDHLDHLYELEIDALYFNPIFESPSSHKYDTTDYLMIDDNFGNYALFSKLVSELNSMGKRVILDGVFNHTGYQFWAFQDIREKGKESAYFDWYFIKGSKPRKYKGHAMNYIAWGGYGDMPKLNVLNPEVTEYIKKVIEKYNSAGISGWRLDVAGEVKPEFWRLQFRPFLKELNENAIMVGEIWGDARVYLQGDLFDSVMNYQFRDAVIEYVARIGHSAKKFVNMTDYYLKRYPPQVLASLWNMLDSHDTERFLTTVYGNEKLFKIAIGLQMTFIGSPVIYYGDEVGMMGGKDPDNRRPMPWKKELWNEDIFNYYKKLISIRKGHPALKNGDYRVISAFNSLLVYKRELGDDILLIIANPGDKAEKLSGITGKYKELLTGETLDIEELYVPSESFFILEPAKAE
ncbi:alpha-amylase [Kosmotoga arenicorallina S304]|uniref:Alpha-amylase n=1 Tax=Kosmotoga arenicorallina S304 TaxID=1453497 RepID=A0A176K202_9BACT|nr:alpha-amylase family glycosyl hydrolase [Kosmotoga arenicorallina]OAA31004.1 alpha-amylase [Kosmotoga arenicorallina S304]